MFSRIRFPGDPIMSHVTTAPTPTQRPQPRHALGMPAGSVRALLAFGVLATLWVIVFKYGTTKLPTVFIYLQFLMVLILVHYFTAHGNSIGAHVDSRSPLGLPRGSVRFLLLAGYGGLAYYLYHSHAEFDFAESGDYLLMLALMLTGFFVGHYLTDIVEWMSGPTLPYWYQDMCAWFGLLAVIGMFGQAIIHVFINPSVAPDLRIGGAHLDSLLAAIIGFYFGVRS
jgi:hypothetical protein